MTKASPTRIEKKLREKDGVREWPAPKSGILLLHQMAQRHQREQQEVLAMLAQDSGVPEGVKATFDGVKFVEQIPDEE